MFEDALKRAVGKACGTAAAIHDRSILVGGSINQSSKVTLTSGERLFIKLTKPGTKCKGMFEAEAEALQLIAASNTVLVPETRYADDECIVQTYFEQGQKASDWHEQIGRQLAQMHQQLCAEHFGFSCDNYLGSTPQRNRYCDDWLTFWQQRRLLPQIEMLSARVAADDALLLALEQLLNRLDLFLADWREPSAFIHGDLWSGNAAANENGAPIIFDPASYYGAREAELGMMRLFGGFGPRTEAAYQEVWPLQADFEPRIEIYRLYHIVNHLIIFGRSYYAEALAVTQSLL